MYKTVCYQLTCILIVLGSYILFIMYRNEMVYLPFSNSLIIHKENSKEILMFNECLDIGWKTAHFCILNFSFKNDFVWEEISNIRRSVSSPDETPRSSERILARWLVESYGLFSKNQLVVYYQCCVLIGWASTGLYVIAEACNPLGVICFWL